jgi:hypothetical protein
MLSVVMLGVVMLSVIMLSVVTQNVVAPASSLVSSLVSFYRIRLYLMIYI